MGISRDDLEKGGTVFLRVGNYMPSGGAAPIQKKRRAEVIDILRGACKIKMLDTKSEKTVRFSDLEADDEYLVAREKREQERRQRIANHEDGPPRRIVSAPPVSVKLVFPESVLHPEPTKPTEAPPPQEMRHIPARTTVAATDDRDENPADTQPNAEVSKRFVAFVRWLMETTYENKFGAQAKVGRELGFSQPYMSQLLNGKQLANMRLALRASEPLGFGVGYYASAEFVPPAEYAKSAATRVEPEPRPKLQQTLELVPRPNSLPEKLAALSKFAEEVSAPAVAQNEFESWLAMGRDVLKPLEMELAACVKRKAELEKELHATSRRMEELVRKQGALAETLKVLGGGSKSP